MNPSSKETLTRPWPKNHDPWRSATDTTAAIQSTTCKKIHVMSCIAEAFSDEDSEYFTSAIKFVPLYRKGVVQETSIVTRIRHHAFKETMPFSLEHAWIHCQRSSSCKTFPHKICQPRRVESHVAMKRDNTELRAHLPCTIGIRTSRTRWRPSAWRRPVRVQSE